MRYAVVTTAVRPPFYFSSTAIRPRYDHSTTFCRHCALNKQAVREAATICPCPCRLTFDLLTLKVVTRVTWATSVPILAFLGLSVLFLGPMYATDRGQTVTDRRQTRIIA